MVSFERRLVLKDLIRHLWIFTLLFGINGKLNISYSFSDAFDRLPL